MVVRAHSTSCVVTCGSVGCGSCGSTLAWEQKTASTLLSCSVFLRGQATASRHMQHGLLCNTGVLLPHPSESLLPTLPNTRHTRANPPALNGSSIPMI